MRRNLLVILAMLLGMATLQAKPVDVAKAQRLGLNFVQHKAMFAKNDVQNIDLAYTFRTESGMAGAYAFNFKLGSVYCNVRAKRPCHGNRALIIPTGRISAEAGHAVGERCCNNCPLRKTL
jgi:hypothetical protein